LSGQLAIAIRAKRDGTNQHQWQVTLPAGTEAKNVQVTATIKDVSTTIALARNPLLTW
jgi:hypothetical protein